MREKKIHELRNEIEKNNKKEKKMYTSPSPPKKKALTRPVKRQTNAGILE